MFEFLRTPTLKVKQANHLASACQRSTVGFSLLYKPITYLPVFLLELHLYEGFISRQEVQSLWQAGLHIVGLGKSNSVETSDAWQASARTLLNRIFQKWSPSDKQSTVSLCDNLMHFMTTLGSAHTRMKYPDNSQPPVVKVGAARRVKFKAFTNILPPIFHQ